MGRPVLDIHFLQGYVRMPFVYNPVGFDPKRFLPSKLHKYSDDARYIVHKIYEQRIRCKTDKNGFIPLKSEYLRNIVSFRKYKEVRESLIQSGVVETDNHYVIGRKAIGYRLSKEWRSKKYQRVEVTNLRLSKNIKKIQKQMYDDIHCDVHIHLYKFLKEIKVDYQEALLSITDTDNFICHQISLEMIDKQEWFFKWDDYGRVHTNITNLKTCFRSNLTHNNEKLLELDISNSQPFFLGCLILNYIKNNNNFTSLNYSLIKNPSIPQPLPSIRCDILPNSSLPKDLQLYINLVQKGDLYNYLTQSIGRKGVTSKEMKVSLFAEVLFCKNYWKSKNKSKFEELFPSVTKVITELKKKDYTSLSKHLQRMESAAMINGVVRRCMEEHPDMFITTIHDSVLCKEKDLEIIQNIMLQVFEEFDMIPKLRIKKV
ncbi:MAG: hypothetical protein ACW99G_07225 [Candidatus Thorarchaeota archaeon]